MAKGIKRGLLIALITTAIIALYVYFKYDPPVWIVFAHHLSNAMFQIALLFLIAGVVIFARLFSYRRRMGLKDYTKLFRVREKAQLDEIRVEEERMNEQDKYAIQEYGRDITMLVAAAVMIIVSILLTVGEA